MIKNYFIFNGTHSDDIGVHVLKMPGITRANERIHSFSIPGRSGNLHESEKAFDNYTKSVECLVAKGADIDRMASILRGSGTIIFSNEPERVYRVTIINQIDIAYAAKKFRNFLLQLDTHPFKFSASPLDDEIIATSAVTFYNRGSWESEPIIEVYGSGNVTLTINNKPYILKNISGSVTVNSEMMEVYKGIENKNNTFEADEFPILNTGENTISWSGSVSKVVIQPNWRWL